MASVARRKAVATRRSLPTACPNLQGLVYSQQACQASEHGSHYMWGNQGQPNIATGGQYYGSPGDIQSQSMGQGMATAPMYFAYPATSMPQFVYGTQMPSSYYQTQMQGQQTAMYAYSPHAGNTMLMMASSPQSGGSSMSYGTYNRYISIAR